MPFANFGSGLIGLAFAGNPENDGHLSPWQEAVGHGDDEQGPALNLGQTRVAA